MINLKQLENNTNILIYLNTMDHEIPYDSNIFLFGFKNGFTHEWTYVIPTIITQNSRYTTFGINLTAQNDDPLNGSVILSPSGNYDYKLWVIETPGLDPASGYLLDAGQAYVEGKNAEIKTITYISDNESEKNIVYLSRSEAVCTKWSTDPDSFGLAAAKWNECL